MSSLERLRALGARIDAPGATSPGGDRALDFGDAETEARRTSSSIGVTDDSLRGRIVVRGGDRRSFLHALLSAPVADLEPGRGVHAMLMDAHAGLIAETFLTAREDAILCDTEPGLGEALLQGLDKLLFTEDVQLEDAAAGLGAIGVHGPDAARMLADWLGVKLPENALDSVALPAIDRAALVVRHDRLLVPGYRIVAPTQAIGALFEEARAHAEAAHGGLLGWNGEEILRVQSGIARFFADYGPGALALETAQDAAIRTDKGCYPGQEVVARVAARGHVNRALRRLRVEGTAAAGDALLFDGKEVGRITSIHAAHALGMVRREVWTPGTQLGISSGGAAFVESEST